MYLSRKNKEIADMFSAIAPTYDLLNHLLSFNIDRKWRKVAIDELEGKVFLDVATGTGDVALQIKRQIKNSKVYGFDLSYDMLKIAKKKANDTDFVCGMAERLPFKDAVFDGVTIAFGFRNVVDRMTALFEFNRVLKPNGKLVILEFNRPVSKFFGYLYEFYSFTVMPFLGKIISGHENAYKYLPSSIRRFPDVDFLSGMMLRAGFKDVRYYPLTFGISFVHVGRKLQEG